MAAEIEINTNTLGSDIESLTTFLNTLRTKNSEMNTAIQELGSMWAGQAHDAFYEQFTLDYETMTEMCSVLQELIGCLSNARTEYDNCENKVSSMISSLAV